MAKQPTSSSETKSAYRSGSTAIKKFYKDFPKVEVLNETLYNARVETIEVLNVPEVLGVSAIDGKWSITRGFARDKTLQQPMEEDPDKTGECLEQMVDSHLLTPIRACSLLNKLKEETIRALKPGEQLDGDLRYELLIGLDGMPKHIKLCHGDFYSPNIIVGDDGKWYLVDWVYVSQGSVSADVVRTYLLLSLKNKKIANTYVDLFCDKTGTGKRYIQDRLPIAVAAQLTYKRPDEKELLESWINVFDYQ